MDQISYIGSKEGVLCLLGMGGKEVCPLVDMGILDLRTWQLRVHREDFCVVTPPPPCPPHTHTHTPAPCLCPGSSAVPELQCCFILSSASEQNRKCSRSHPLHGEECPGCGHLSTFLCPPISHMLLLLACLVTPLLIHLISVPSPEKPAFYNYYRAGSAATDLGRKRSRARSHTQSCSEWEF